MRHLWPIQDQIEYRQRQSTNPRLASPRDLESKGWEVWLKTLFPFAFDESFSSDHKRYWDLRWSVLLRIRAQQKCVEQTLPIPDELLISDDEYVCLLILGRGLAKSSSLEAAAVMRGALLDGGYCLYLSEAQDQAEEHIGNCQGLINHEDSRLLEFYPRMAIVDDAIVAGIKTKNRSDLFITLNGWICRAKGLNSKLRGLRIGIRRPDDIKLDDVDGVNDSIDVSVKKLKQIKSSVLPTQARRWATVDFGQNLILESGVMNQLYTGQSDALAKRQTIGATKTFSIFDYESRIDDADGKTKHYILSTSIPTWSGVNIAQAQKFLHDSGLITFMAEYQNEFEMMREGRVLRNYDDALMVITEDDFARVFGSINSLDLFNKWVGHDFARTKSAYHAPVMGKLAVSNQNTKLPGKLFMFDLMSFEGGTQVDDMAQRMLKSISLGPLRSQYDWDELIASSLSRAGLERFISDTTALISARREVLAGVIAPLVGPVLEALNYQQFVGSHDQNKDGLQVMRTAYGLPFLPLNPGETGGLEWADHYMKVDKSLPHPFFDDVQEDGKWKLGCPGFFIVVKKDKYAFPQSPTPDLLHDSDLARYQFSHWRMRPLKVTEAGVIEHGPMKMNDDFGQMLQMILFGNNLSAAPLAYHEKVEEAMPERHRKILEQANHGGLSPEDELTLLFAINRAKQMIDDGGIEDYDEYGDRVA